MRCMIEMESTVRGLLWVNGQFCGPVDGEGQTFPASENAEVFIQFFPLDGKTKPVALEMVLQNGSIARLEPETVGYALLWADGVIQLEIRKPTNSPMSRRRNGRRRPFFCATFPCGWREQQMRRRCSWSRMRRTDCPNMMRLFRSDLRR